MSKIIDCITFFNENYIFNLRYRTLERYVDQFVVCESRYDHKGVEKKLNFEKKYYDQKKINYIILEKEFPAENSPWKNQAFQRDYMLKNLSYLDKDDYIFFSDPDEIINPKLLNGFKLEERYGIFLQKCFNYKFNLFNSYESPWEGTRVCMKKNLKSIDFMRQKVKVKNLRYNFLRIDKEKSIEVFKDGGWHFNNIMTPEEISIKLKTFAHSEFEHPKFSNPEIIKKKIKKKIDLFERGHQYEIVKIDRTFPENILKEVSIYENYIDKEKN
jgi:beta-1,4-mannosyl-glycoprotein beta-1,4-N-acetylglucosaminyltransferase